jgi:cell wall-associated NlpC family hydrolase
MEPAGPVRLAVAPGTAVDAVTAGTISIIPAGAGMSAIVLSGTDGATYTYRDVTASVAQRAKVAAGSRIAVSGPRGLTFSVSVPDVRGGVDAGEAMQAWAAGLSVNVRALPSTITPAAAPARRQVLLVTDGGAGATAANLAKSLAGPLVAVRAERVSDPLSPRGQAAAARQMASAGAGRLLLVVLANGTPAQAAALAARLPAGRDVLWVAPPGTTRKQAAAYRAIVAARPGFRVESLPAALAAVNGPAASGQRWSPTGALATATLVAAYASTAYRLQSESAQARTVVSWAEQQLGKPYQWAAAGPGSFDCSGLTMDALAQAGIAVTHNANAQWLQTKTRSVPENQLAPGDLVFFAGSDGTLKAPGHVGIYVGNGEIIDAPFTGARVRFDPLASIGGYVGGTDPYAAAPAGGATTPAGGISMPVFAGGVQAPAPPGAMNQYQSFAEALTIATWGAAQFPYLNLLWQRESGWNPAATNPVSGAFGIPQALPAVKMASAGLDWATDPYTQIIWGINYIRAAYGTPQSAWAHELAAGWY